MRALVVVIVLAGACRERPGDNLEKLVTSACGCKAHLEQLAAKDSVTSVDRIEAKACADEARRLVPAVTGEPSHREQKLARELLDCVAQIYNFDAPSGPGSSEPASARTP